MAPSRGNDFISADIQIDSWEDLKPYFDQLIEAELGSKDQLDQWLLDWSDLEAVVSENLAWRYIRMTIDTTDKQHSQSYENFIAHIQPEISRQSNRLNKKFIQCPFSNELEGEAFSILLRSVKSEIEIFREANVPLMAEIGQLSQKFGAITGALSIELDGQTLTLPAAGAELQSPDREHRERVWNLIEEKRAGVRDQLDNLFDQLIKLRHRVAVNAGFTNFRDYMFVAMGRFDYTAEDCFAFHQSVAKEIVPLTAAIYRERTQSLGVDTLKPWDLAVDPENRPKLKPFDDAEELIDRSVRAFSKTDPYFGECLSKMKQQGLLDLSSKPGKAPGGYNYPLYVTGAPFIFMNAVGTQRDLVTMMHEGGHAVHSFLTHELTHTSFKSCPSEVAELASMAMELMSMDQWDVFYADAAELKRAKIDQLQDVISMLPWIAMIDQFQHWIYENPVHSTSERRAEWKKINERFSTGEVDYTGHEDARLNAWQKQLHLFEVPFYYIEYGMAQLGSIAVWRNFKKEPTAAVEAYKNALSLGYTKGIKNVYQTAGIEFNFSRAYIHELANFVQEELKSVQNS